MLAEQLDALQASATTNAAEASAIFSNRFSNVVSRMSKDLSASSNAQALSDVAACRATSKRRSSARDAVVHKMEVTRPNCLFFGPNFPLTQLAQPRRPLLHMRVAPSLLSSLAAWRHAARVACVFPFNLDLSSPMPQVALEMMQLGRGSRASRASAERASGITPRRGLEVKLHHDASDLTAHHIVLLMLNRDTHTDPHHSHLLHDELRQVRHRSPACSRLMLPLPSTRRAPWLRLHGALHELGLRA